MNERLRLALPYTILSGPGTVRLVAGEDSRYTLAAPGLEGWLPELLGRLDGRLALDDALATVPDAERDGARALVARLVGERVLVPAAAADAHVAVVGPGLRAEGRGPVLARLEKTGEIPVLVQDRLDWGEALAWNRRCLAGTRPFLFVTHGPMSRGYVSPLFLPRAGPCLACLVSHFRRLSPAPEIYDALIEQPGAIEPVPFPEDGNAILAALVRWKAALAGEALAPTALYRLHVLETASLEVSSHRVLADPACAACAR